MEYNILELNSSYKLTNFSGSQSLGLCTKDKVYLFVDTRYHAQADIEVKEKFIHIVKVPLAQSMTDAFFEILPEKFKLGIPSKKISKVLFEIFEKKLSEKKGKAILLDEDIIEKLDTTFIPDKYYEIFEISPHISGCSIDDKINSLIKKYNGANLIITDLSDISYFTNLRSFDFPYISSFLSKLIVNSKGATLYINSDVNFCSKMLKIKYFEEFYKDLKLIKPKDLLNRFILLNFPDLLQEKENIDKFIFEPNEINDSSIKNTYFFYNKKIGLTLRFQKLLIRNFQKGRKTFYCNLDFLFNENKMSVIRHYIFFYLSFLYSIDDREKYQKFIEDNILNWIFKVKAETLIKKLLKIIHENFDDPMIIIDNIKTKHQFDIIKGYIEEYGTKNILAFIQINENTLDLLLKIKYKFMESNEDSELIQDDYEYYLPLLLGKTNIKKIKNDYYEMLKPLFDEINIEKYLSLLRLKYLLSSREFEIDKLIQIKSLVKFLNISINDSKVKEITFRNKLLKKVFNNYYMNYIVKFKNTNPNIFYEISKSEEGIYFERQIIYDLIVNSGNIKKAKVEQIYSIDKFPDFNFDNNREYLFIQEKPNAPYYDIAYLYHSGENIILKCCQIGINKDEKSLSKLDKIFIFFDLFYFCHKFCHEKNIQINKVEFCIITTYNAYKEYKKYINNKIDKKDRKYNNFENMKIFCENNKYTFLIFDVKTSKYYRYNNEDKLIETNFKYYTFQENVTNIFNDNIYVQSTKKLNYYYDPKNPNIIAKIDLPNNFNITNLNNEWNFKIDSNMVIYMKKAEENKNKLKINEDNESKRNKKKSKKYDDNAEENENNLEINEDNKSKINEKKTKIYVNNTKIYKLKKHEYNDLKINKKKIKKYDNKNKIYKENKKYIKPKNKKYLGKKRYNDSSYEIYNNQ